MAGHAGVEQFDLDRGVEALGEAAHVEAEVNKVAVPEVVAADGLAVDVAVDLQPNLCKDGGG